ncbi:NeuD/PglB/VioB family sugar acetyltransferase [Anaerotruncus colihominis]|uniref:NeuD/PglB/VioB family sugar acetyltransferase n=1 Tax=Anaerotruncus colihominis TaxID=169435 RepID=UPI002671642C|nr:NeuD/PglB/VioB family sugar acetyltransferase [Anaerotruncus colihominis]
MSKKRLGIYGAGGLGRESYFLAERINAVSNHWSDIFFIDDFVQQDGLILSWDKVKICSNPDETELFIACGEPILRHRLAKKVTAEGYALAALVSPNIQLPNDVQIGNGVALFDGCIVMPNVRIGENTCVASGCILSHDSKIGMDCYLSPGCVVCGHVSIDDCSFLGAGCTIRNNLVIGPNTIIGVGAAVVKDVKKQEVVVGVPARFVRWNKNGRVFM